MKALELILAARAAGGLYGHTKLAVLASGVARTSPKPG